MKKIIVAILGLSLAAATLTTFAQKQIVQIPVLFGAPKMMAFKPNWCDAVDPDRLNRSTDSLWSYMKQIKEDGAIWEKSRDVMERLCIEPENSDFQAQAGFFAQAWANEVGLTLDQLAPFFLVFANQEKFETAQKATCTELEVSEEASNRIKVLSVLERRLYGCIGDMDQVPQFIWNSFEYGIGQENYWIWHLDRLAEPPSEAARAYLVLACLKYPQDWNKPDPNMVVRYSWFGSDARALDTKKLETQMLKQSEFEKTIMQMTHGRAKFLATRYDLAAKQLAKDIDWKTLLFDTPEATMNMRSRQWLLKMPAILLAWRLVVCIP